MRKAAQPLDDWLIRSAGVPLRNWRVSVYALYIYCYLYIKAKASFYIMTLKMEPTWIEMLGIVPKHATGIKAMLQIQISLKPIH